MIEVFGECLETIRDIINNSSNKYKDKIAIREKKNKKIEIVSGNGKDLNISPVYDHIDIEKPKEEKGNKKIIIPEEKKTK